MQDGWSSSPIRPQSKLMRSAKENSNKRGLSYLRAQISPQIPGGLNLSAGDSGVNPATLIRPSPGLFQKHLLQLSASQVPEVSVEHRCHAWVGDSCSRLRCGLSQAASCADGYRAVFQAGCGFLGAGIGLDLVNSVKHEPKTRCDSHCVQTATVCGSLAFLELVCLLQLQELKFRPSPLTKACQQLKRPQLRCHPRDPTALSTMQCADFSHHHHPTLVIAAQGQAGVCSALRKA